MDNFNENNGMKSDETLDAAGENYNLSNGFQQQNGAEKPFEEVAMDDMRWEEPQRSMKKHRKNRGIISVLIGAILGSVITLGATYAFLPEILKMRGISFSGAQQEITINPTGDLNVYSAVAKKAMPSVVGITTVALQRDWFFGEREVSGVGTGVIVDARGYILTNSHVVGDGNVKEVTVLLNDGRQLKADVLWSEKSLDLAIIKVEGDNLAVAELGDSDQIEVGEIAIAIGNPLGLSFQRSLTQGVISGLNRTITDSSTRDTIENLIQTDASINPGNSGGPLLNAKGQVIGINTAKISSGEGLGFAIPINTAKPIVDQFIEKGEFKRVYLGIQGVDIDVFERATGVDLKAEQGVYVVEVTEDSAALRAGIRPTDIIVKIGDDHINRMSNLVRTIYKYRPGDKTTVTVLRNNEEVKLDLTF